MITTVPGDTPCTTPVVEPTVAIAVAPDVQTPPLDVVSLSVTLPPTHTAAPAITGSVIDTRKSSGHARLVNVMIDVPEATPVTMPDAEPTVAMPVLLLVHTP